MTIKELKNEKIGLCISGGLDSRTITKKLIDMGTDVICFTADLAQPDEPDISNIQKKMAECGAKTVIIDLKNQMAEACFKVLKAQAMYDGGYWNTTGIARAVTVAGLLPEMKKQGCTVLAHGATGRGNDQVRFERYTNVLSPDIKVYAPWRDSELLAEFPGRTEMTQYLKRSGIKGFEKGTKKYSTDSNLAGLSHEAEDLESLETSCKIVTPIMGVWPDDAPDQTERFTVRLEKALPVKINGQTLTPLEVMKEANAIGGRNGIGIKNALENRIIGTKSRGVYEAPGMELLGRCIEIVYQATMDRTAMQLFRDLSRLVASQIYDGHLFDPATTAALAAIEHLAAFATGTVQVALYKGNIYFEKLTDCKSSLYNQADSSMEKSNGLKPANAQGFVEIENIKARSLYRAGQIEK